eukprot:172456-Pyramimonas_sp.AAC.1
MALRARARAVEEAMAQRRAEFEAMVAPTQLVDPGAAAPPATAGDKAILLLLFSSFSSSCFASCSSSCSTVSSFPPLLILLLLLLVVSFLLHHPQTPTFLIGTPLRCRDHHRRQRKRPRERAEGCGQTWTTMKMRGQGRP